MRARIVLRDADFSRLRDHVLGGPIEEAAVCLGGWIQTEDLTAITVRDVYPVPPEAVVRQHGAVVEIDPVWLAARIKEARYDRLGVVIVHSHPFAATGVRFSGTDIAGQTQLIPRLQRRVPGVPHAELVFGPASIDGVIWQANATRSASIDVVRVIGEALHDLPITSATRSSATPLIPEHERQVLFLGEEGQRRLHGLRVGLVGAGGDGSAMGVSLLHLGVGTLVVIDPDVVEATNRNRLIDASPQDDGVTPKVELLRRYGEGIGFPTEVVPIQARVETAWRALRDCDVVFGCTDNVSSRFVLNRVAAQYLIPLIDTGMEIEVVDGRVRTIAGRVTVVRPGDVCLEAAGFTSEAAALAEVQNGRRPGYLDDDPAASALPANLLVAGTAGLEFLKLVHGLLGGSKRDRYLAYSARSGELRGCQTTAGSPCACEQLAGLGDAGPDPAPLRSAEGQATA